MIKRIFLDSNHWIYLAQVSKGIKKDPILVEVYQKIKKLSDSGDVIFPFSLFHLEDLLKNTNQKQREFLVDFMMNISKGYVLKPFSVFREKEIENAFLHKLGLTPIHDIKSKILAKGIAYVAGEEYFFTSKNPEVQKIFDEKDKEIRDKINSLEFMEKQLKSKDFSIHIKQGHQMYLDGAVEMEKNRRIRRTWKKSERFDNEIKQHFINSVFPYLFRINAEKKLSPKLSEFFKTKKDIEEFIESIPGSNILIRLTFARDEESFEREVKPNDIIDVAHLSGAVPYCDIVVAEKMFASICKRIKLDKKYNCVVINSLKDLNDLL